MARFPLVPTAPEPERAILVGVEWRDNAWPLDRSLDELERLAHTAGAQWRVCHSIWLSRIQNRLSVPVRLKSCAAWCIAWMLMSLFLTTT